VVDGGELMSVEILEDQIIYTTSNKQFIRNIIKFTYDDGRVKAECYLHDGVAELKQVDDGWKVIRIVY
jgi:uncharacterized surface anchored protein